MHSNIADANADNYDFPVVADSSCIRCSQFYEPGEKVLTIKNRQGGNEICIEVHERCMEATVDQVVRTFDISSEYTPPKNRTWPKYIGGIPMKHSIFDSQTHKEVGLFLRMFRTDTGFFRLGLYRGHAEIWTENMTYQMPIEIVYCFNKGFTMCGPFAKMPDRTHKIVETKFVPLDSPIQLQKGWAELVKN